MEKRTFLNNSFVGAGWNYSLTRGGIGVNGQGNIGLVEGDLDVAKSIFIILSTAPGERVMRTDFGCGIHDLVFSSPSPQIFGLISYHVEQALGRWEPRVEVVDVVTTVDSNAPECLLVNIIYKVKQTNSERNLVYPFYVIPRGQD